MLVVEICEEEEDVSMTIDTYTHTTENYMKM